MSVSKPSLTHRASFNSQVVVASPIQPTEEIHQKFKHSTTVRFYPDSPPKKLVKKDPIVQQPPP